MQSETYINSPPVKSQVSMDVDGGNLVLFSGKIVRQSGALAFRGPLAQFFLTVAMGKAVWLQKIGEQEEVCIGVRAKHIRMGHAPTNEDVSVFGKVEKTSSDELNGNIKVRLANDGVVLRAGNEIEYNEGDPIQLQFSRNDAVLFRCSLDDFSRETMPLALAMV